jgi:hypothetical protein
MWPSIFYALTAILCASCLAGSISAVLTARAERDSVLRNLRLCESQIKLQRDSLEDLRIVVEGIAQSQKMQRVRRATTHAVGSSGEPDAKSDPEAWRAWKNSQLRTGVVN